MSVTPQESDAPTITLAVPDLDRWSRIERLYKTLLGMGLWVNPVLIDRGEFSDIAYLQVSVDQPELPQDHG